MRAPLSRSRPLPSLGSRRLPVAHGALVGGLRLGGELLLGPAQLLVGDPDAGWLALADGGAGDELEPPQLLGGQRRLLVGVVLAAGEHAPEQHRELACGGDDRLAVPAARPDPQLERAQRPGLAYHAPGRLNQRPARRDRPALGDAARAGRLLAGLPDPWIETEVGDQLPRVAKAGDVADRGQEGAGADQVHARDGHQPLGLGPGQQLLGDHTLDLLDLTVQERDVAQRGPDRLRLLGRRLSRRSHLLGRNSAEDVEVILVSVRAESDGPVPSGSVADERLLEGSPLKWSEVDAARVSLPPGVARHFALVHVDNMSIEADGDDLGGSRRSDSMSTPCRPPSTTAASSRDTRSRSRSPHGTRTRLSIAPSSSTTRSGGTIRQP